MNPSDLPPTWVLWVGDAIIVAVFVVYWLWLVRRLK